MKKSMKVINRAFSIIFIIMLLTVQIISVQAIDINLKPTSLKYINDYVGIIDSASENFMVSLGNEIESKTGAQMTTVVIKSLQGADITAYANQLFRQWGIGQNGKDNGLLILLSIDDKKWRVEVGRGLEGTITDIYSARVMDESAPLFAQKQYGQGLVKAYSAFADNIAKEYNVTLDNNNLSKAQVGKTVTISPIYGYILLGLLLMDLLFNKARVSKLILYALFWGSFFGGGRRNGGFGSGGGGGSGGFGGGTSGGGGSSGGW